jgi:iron uptake system component EfeO
MLAASAVSARGDSVAAAPVRIEVTDSTCEPNELNLSTGRVTFSIHNATARALEWEILDGVMVVDERENIGPGLVRNLTAKLAPGEYQMTCGYLTNPKGRLHVAALDGAAPKISQLDLIGPLAEYRVYASYEIDGLVDDTRRLAEALKTGDIETARASFSVAHAHYARLAPIALFFPDLDGDVDRRFAERGTTAADPSSIGFRQLEWDLAARADPHHLSFVADTLVADVVAMQARFENLPLTPAPTIAGAAEAIGVDAEADAHSGSDLSDLRANIEGVQKIVELFRPLIDKADDRLSRALCEDIATLGATLLKYQNSDGAFAPMADIGEDRAILRSVLKKLASDLALIPAALGIG